MSGLTSSVSLSSPVKGAAASTSNRQSRSETALQDGIPELIPKDFLEQHLSSESTPLTLEEKIMEASKAFKDSSNEYESYEPLCKLLNGFSTHIHEILRNKKCAAPEKLVFINHHSKGPTYHVDEFKDEPDILCVVQSVAKLAETSTKDRYSGVPWHHVESAGEVKHRQDSLSQAVAYLGTLNQSRPDKPGVYGFSISSKDYRIVWSDAGGVVTSDSIPFEEDQLQPLYNYVYSLYSPPADHFTSDPSVKLANACAPLSEKPKWNVTWDGKTYHDCEVVFVGRPWTRMSWVAVCPASDAGGPWVVKDSYRVWNRTWHEDTLIQKVHKNGEDIVPGWVRIIEKGSGIVQVDGKPISSAGPGGKREKTRIVMKTYGDPLRECKSVLQFLKVMYDGLEAHRFAVLKGVLHRDISMSNVLINVRNVEEATLQEATPSDDERPIYIDEVLDSKKKKAQPHALIVDLDNGCDYGTVSDAIYRDEPGRTGTPMFIARSVSNGTVLNNYQFLPMPILEPKSQVAEAYRLSHQRDPYRSYVDDESHFHGGEFDVKTHRMHSLSLENSYAFSHRPDHDVESFYWVMVAFLLRAKPAPDSADNHGARLQNAWKALRSHTIPKDDDDADSRLPILVFGIHAWTVALHPKLEVVAPLLADLSVQITPEYALLNPKPRWDHLHEAAQRLLFRHIHSMENGDPILLYTGTLRTVKEPAYASSYTSSEMSPGNRRVPTFMKHLRDEADEAASGFKKTRRK